MKLTRLNSFPAVTFTMVLLIFMCVSCQHEGIPADQMEQICFNQQVLPIFQNSCAISGCHNAQTAEGGYVFTDYSNIMKSITPGNASKSKAYKAITSQIQLMPPHNPLPMDKRILIRVWIDQGAKETDCTPGAWILNKRTVSQWVFYTYNSKSTSNVNVEQKFSENGLR